MWVVLMLPPVPRMPGKTERLYASLKANRYTDGQITDRFVTVLTKGREIALSMLFNVLGDVVVDSFTGLGEYRQRFLEVGAREVHLAGSGPALFTLVKDKTQAEKIYHNLQQQGLESYLTETLDAIEKVE
jgi:4-diphosphocytidyl-2-C-methyl-D-erythritol kinase